MSKVIDLELELPPTAEQIINQMRTFARGRTEPGQGNYRNIFGPGKARDLGLTIEQVDRMYDELSPKEFENEMRKRAEPLVTSLPSFIEDLDRAGIEWGLIEAPSSNRGVVEKGVNDKTAEIVAQFPRKFIGQAIVSPHDGMKGIRELERAVKELGLKSVLVSPFRTGVRANDKKCYPIYAKAIELGIPVFIYTGMNYNTSLPWDVGYPGNLDEIAMDFPELTIVAGWGGGGGWPWVPDMVGVARRHQNIYINFSDHRPRHLATPGSGWEMMLQFGNTLLQDRIVFASGWSGYFSYSKDIMKTVIQEMRSLPLKEEVKEKWLYKNAARLFHRE